MTIRVGAIEVGHCAHGAWGRRMGSGRAGPIPFIINPQPESVWDHHESIRITRQLMGDRMFPLTLEGLDRGMRLLSKAH